MNEEKLANIISHLKSNPNISLTALAKLCGFSKSKSIEEEINHLVSKGEIKVEKDGRYDKHSYCGGSLKTQKKDEKVEMVELPSNGDNGVLPEAAERLLEGYKISNIKFKGESMKKIVCPNGKAIRISTKERLLVINEEPKFVVETAEQVLTCIKKYSQDNGLTVFTVDDICQNKKIGTADDVMVKDQHIMFLTIKKHNKAAMIIPKIPEPIMMM